MNDLSEAPHVAGGTGKTAPSSTPVAIGRTVRAWSTSVSDFRGPITQWWSRQPLARFLAASLSRRILFSNLVALIILLGGMLYLSLSHAWLLDAKVEVVKTLSRITAEAIAYRAVNDNARALFDPNRLPDREAPRARRDDAFAALELPIGPERAAPILKKLIQPTDLDARIYSSKGSLIVDSVTLFGQGTADDAPAAVPNADPETPRLRNFWTRLHYWLINKELKVYRDLGTANGFLYPEVKRAAQEGKETPILLLTSKGEQIVAMAEPIKRGSTILGVLFVSTKPGQIDAVLWEERWLILQIAAVGLIASIISALMLVRVIGGPMKRLSDSANQVSRNIAARQDIPDFVDRRDEVGQMGRAFKAMTDALYRRIEASEKFAADVAHELKNPLAAARSTAEALTYARTTDDRDELVRQIQDELKRLNRLINDVANASRLDAELARQEMLPINIRNVLESVTAIFRELLSEESRKVALSIEPVSSDLALTVLGNDGRLGQVFTNLVDNAISFSPENGTVTITVRTSSGQIEIAVEDEGPGIPADRLQAVFERFYSDRPTTDSKRGKNSGLGLSISREIISSHRGLISAENRLAPDDPAGAPIGARFIVKLPVANGLEAAFGLAQ